MRKSASSTDIASDEKTAFEKDWGCFVDFIIDRGDALLPGTVAAKSQSQALEGRLDGLEQGVQDLKGDMLTIIALFR